MASLQTLLQELRAEIQRNPETGTQAVMDVILKLFRLLPPVGTWTNHEKFLNQIRELLLALDFFVHSARSGVDRPKIQKLKEALEKQKQERNVLENEISKLEDILRIEKATLDELREKKKFLQNIHDIVSASGEIRQLFERHQDDRQFFIETQALHAEFQHALETAGKSLETAESIVRRFVEEFDQQSQAIQKQNKR